MFGGALGITLLGLIIGVVGVRLWLAHLVAEQMESASIEEMARRGVLFEGPEGVRVREGEGGRVWVEVIGRAGVDVRRAMAWEDRETGSWRRRFEGRVARFGVGKVGSVRVRIGQVQVGGIGGEELVRVDGVRLRLPVSYPSLNESAKMDDVTLAIPIELPAPRVLAAWVQEVWEKKEWRVKVDLHDLAVNPTKRTGVLGAVLHKIGGVSIGEITKVVDGEGESMNSLRWDRN